MFAAPASGQDREVAPLPRPAGQAAQTPPATTPLQDLVKRDQLFGDWGGARGKMDSEGTKLDVSFTQFFQWVPNRDTPLLQDPTGAVTTK